MSMRKMISMAAMATVLATVGIASANARSTEYPPTDMSPQKTMPAPEMQPGMGMHKMSPELREKMWQEQYGKLTAEQKKAVDEVVAQFNKLDDEQKHLVLMKIKAPMGPHGMKHHMMMEGHGPAMAPPAEPAMKP